MVDAAERILPVGSTMRPRAHDGGTCWSGTVLERFEEPAAANSEPSELHDLDMRLPVSLPAELRHEPTGTTASVVFGRKRNGSSRLIGITPCDAVGGAQSAVGARGAGPSPHSVRAAGVRAGVHCGRGPHRMRRASPNRIPRDARACVRRHSLSAPPPLTSPHIHTQLPHHTHGRCPAPA